VTIPVVLAATLAVMQVNGYSLDNLTLMALIIAVGFVVDDAVIVIENIMGRIERGETALAAALSGSRQIGFTIISISAALTAAMIPLLFMPDVVGRYLREFAVAVVAAIVASAFVSLTLAPVMCSRMLRGPEHLGLRRRPTLIAAFYGRTLEMALRHPAVVLVVIALITGASVWLYVSMPKAFMPTQDTGVMFVRTIAMPNISFEAMREQQRTVIDRIRRDPAVSGLSSWISDGSGGSLSLGSMVVALKPLDQRKLDIQKVIARLKARTSDIQGVRTFFVPFQDLNIGTQSSDGRYQYTMWGTNNGKVFAAANDMVTRIRALPQVTDVVSSWETSGLQAGLTIGRHYAATFGVTATAVDSILNDAFSQRQLNTLYLRDNFSRVILEVDPEAQTDPSVFQRLYVPGRAGTQVPLAAITRPWRAHANMWVRHSMQFPSYTISFDTKPGFSISEAIDAIRQTEADAHLPGEVKAEFRGEAAEAAKVGLGQVALFILAVVAIYLVLGVLYESYVHPLTILSILPPTVFGALLALWIAGLPFTVISSIACILVVGMVMKNAIMMVDFALEGQRQNGLSARDAISLAARQRARPIVMTMLVSALSALPLVWGLGPGHELRQPIGITLVGGLFAAQLVTLYTTPVMYLILESLRQRMMPARYATVSHDAQLPQGAE
jgi:multidrug efflux pump subunit AcrB